MRSPRCDSRYDGRMTLRLLVAPSLLALLLAGCGGSSSETPWPVEPRGFAQDPVSESAEQAEPTNSAATNEREDPAGSADEAKPARQKRPEDPQGMKR